MSRLLEIDGLAARYGPITAFKDFCLDLEEGQSAAVVGPNGAGKSSLLLVLAGILKPASGHIRLEGRVTDRMTPEHLVRLGVALVPERRRILRTLTVRENLMLGGSAFGTRRQGIRRTRRALDGIVEAFPELGRHLNARAYRLSGGEQQMLAIGRALIGGPRLLLLDEPSLGLSPLLVDRVFDIMQQLRDDTSISLLLVEQNALRAIEFADQSSILRTGEQVFTGSRAEMLAQSDLARKYLGYN